MAVSKLIYDTKMILEAMHGNRRHEIPIVLVKTRSNFRLHPKMEKPMYFHISMAKMQAQNLEHQGPHRLWQQNYTKTQKYINSARKNNSICCTRRGSTFNDKCINIDQFLCK